MKEEETQSRDLTYGNLFELVRLLTEGELEKGFDNVKRIPRNKLIDLLNYLNFSEREFLVVFQHPHYDEIITRAIKPQPYQEGPISGLWAGPEDFSESLRDFEVLCFLIENKREILLARSRRVEIDEQGIELTLPEFGFEIIITKNQSIPLSTYKSGNDPRWDFIPRTSGCLQRQLFPGGNFFRRRELLKMD